jgi:Sec23/Sec24 zinc finger.
MKSLTGRLRYFFLREIRRKKKCPACRKHYMRVNKKSGEWKCEFCGYSLSIEEFESGVVFRYCDGCREFLNNQDGFSDKKKFFVCRQCGYMNHLPEDHAKQ